jgi:hypothetical protein
MLCSSACVQDEGKKYEGVELIILQQVRRGGLLKLLVHLFQCKPRDWVKTGGEQGSGTAAAATRKRLGLVSHQC